MVSDDQPTDEELVRLYLSGTEGAGEAFFAIYGRYRATVRGELEAAGLSAREAENHVGAVFTRALDPSRHIGAEIDLRALLINHARDIACSPR